MRRNSSKEPMRGRTVFTVSAALHFAVTRIVSALTLNVVDSASIHQTGEPYAQALGLVSKILYFPVITLALYPREIFPGNWILVPIAVNSLLWALIILAVWAVAKNRKG